MAELDVERVLSDLTNDEKVALLSVSRLTSEIKGIDFWHTTPIPRLGVPSIRTSDGPNGVRGTRFFNGVPAACFPCGTALGATWDPQLLRQAGNLMGEEARLKGAAVVLGPTVNMQRGPLGGRGFESFSEDPVLSGSCAAAIIDGIQEKGLLATIKHFVANDQEHERAAVDVIVSERALREIYLLPFQIAVRDANPAAFMTAYNKINGLHVSENPRFIQEILRQDWGWEGLVMSDWYGVYSTSAAVNAGLDLEMPGPTRWRGPTLSHALSANKVKYHTLDQRVRTVLNFVKRAMASGVPENAEEKTGDTPETSEFLRKVAADSIVLMKNEKSVLPLSKGKATAVIGPNAKVALFAGGGSASLRPYYSVSPYEGILANMGIENTKYSLGVSSHKDLPLLGKHLRTHSGEKGVIFRAFVEPPSVEIRGAVDEVRLDTTSLFFGDYYHPRIQEELWWAEVEGIFTPDQDGDYEFGLTVYGTATLFIEGHLIVDNETKQQPGDSFFGSGTIEEIGTTKLKAGKDYTLRILWASAPTSKLSRPGETAFRGGGLRLGGTRKIREDVEINAAVHIAAQVDQVVLCAGLNAEWESEGCDRAHMSLPGRSDELISAVAKANANTVVVIQSGTPVEMPWIDEVSAIVQAWYGGNECGNAIADILFGDVNPSGKLPISFPIRNQDNPAYLNFRSEGGRVLYGEDVYVGYRYYDTVDRNVAFSFGHGLSYTTFLISDLQVKKNYETLDVSLRIRNSGQRSGAETVQLYVSQALPSIRRPLRELKGFRKVFLEAGAETSLNISVATKYATSYWDETRSMWVSEKDTYTVYVGTSSANLVANSSFDTDATVWWTGV
ncbi:hypothetical protein MMC07_003211 [Pseudocyphellaria aurata]|nr:hypothetical protein [Pseudocyphellaria aurata]